MEEEIVDVDEGLETVIFCQNTVRHIFVFPEACQGSYFKTGPSFVSLTWLVTGISKESKDFVPS